jgi:hypothetical protein
MTSNNFMKVGVFAALSCLAACTPKEDPTPDDPPDDSTPDDQAVDPYLPDINNTWQVRGEPEHTFTFSTLPEGPWPYIAVEGFEVPAGGAARRQLSGRRDKWRIHFTATMGTNVRRFEGIIVNSDRTIHLRGEGDPPHIVLCAFPCNTP